MGVTLNKDGTPRKIGSGKTKGAGCFAKIKWEQLREFIKEDDDILVGRVWLRSVGALNQKKGSRKKLTPPPPSVPKPTKQKAAPSSSAPQLKQTSRTVKNPKIGQPTPERSEEDDYDPPPLFASIGEIKKY
jgi:hypothetical protein